MRDPKSYLSTISPVSSPVLDHAAFLSLGNAYNSCLDSGCTDHIVKDRCLFQTYDVSGAVEIGTANCGFLLAKGSGDVFFRVPYHDRFVIFTMRGCLHAPDTPINLISVGALTDNRLTVTFRPDAPTVISYPDSDPVICVQESGSCIAQVRVLGVYILETNIAEKKADGVE